MVLVGVSNIKFELTAAVPANNSVAVCVVRDCTPTSDIRVLCTLLSVVTKVVNCAESVVVGTICSTVNVGI